MNNRQSTFDRQLDSGHLGRFGSQVGYFEINEGDSKNNSNRMMLTSDSKIMHNAVFFYVESYYCFGKKSGDFA